MSHSSLARRAESPAPSRTMSHSPAVSLQISPNLEALLQHDEMIRALYNSSPSPPDTKPQPPPASSGFAIGLPLPPPRHALGGAGGHGAGAGAGGEKGGGGGGGKRPRSVLGPREHCLRRNMSASHFNGSWTDLLAGNGVPGIVGSNSEGSRFHFGQSYSSPSSPCSSRSATPTPTRTSTPTPSLLGPIPRSNPYINPIPALEDESDGSSGSGSQLSHSEEVADVGAVTRKKEGRPTSFGGGSGRSRLRLGKVEKMLNKGMGSLRLTGKGDRDREGGRLFSDFRGRGSDGSGRIGKGMHVDEFGVSISKSGEGVEVECDTATIATAPGLMAANCNAPSRQSSPTSAGGSGSRSATTGQQQTAQCPTHSPSSRSRSLDSSDPANKTPTGHQLLVRNKSSPSLACSPSPSPVRITISAGSTVAPSWDHYSMAASSRKTKEHESFMDLLSPHSPDREDAQPRPPTNKHERILGIETSAVQNKHRRTSLLAPPRPPMPRCITASNLEEQMTFAPNSSDSVPPSPLNFDDPTPDNVSVRSNVSSIQFARRTPSPVASDSDSPRRSHFNPSSTSLASLAPIEFAEPPSPVYVRKPSLPRESKPQFDRDKKPPYLSKRSASASPHLHSIALPPEESNKLCASDREALIRRNRKIAQVFGQTPGTMTMATDSYFKDASPVILQPEEDASRFLKLLPQSALSALLGSARQKDKSHRHAMSVSVAMRSATGPPSAKALKDGPGPLSPWQVVESPWAIEGRRHSSPLSPEKAAFLDPAADLLGDHRHHQHHYQQLHHHHQTGTTHAASATDTARDRDSPDQLQQEWNARLRAYKLLQDQGQQQPSPLRTNKPRNLSPSSSFIDLSDEEGPPTALPSSPSHARTRGRSSPPPPPSSSSPGTASAWDKSSISSGGTVHRVSRSASIADSASVLSLGSLASRTSQEMAEIERRQKRDRLAKLHRFLGSRVPADLVIGPGAMPGDTSGLPPLAYGSPDGRSWAAQGGGGGGGRSSSRNRSGSGSAVITPPQYERIKEELGGEEKALNVRRAQKMEKVFGAAPPQTLYHTRPLPIPPCLVPGSVPGAAARTVSQPTSPLGPSPSVDGTGLSSSSQFQFQPPHQSQSQFPSHSQSHSQSQSQQFQQLPPPSPSSPTSSRNPNQSAYTKSKHKGKRQYRPSTSESAHPLIPKRRGSDASIKSIVGVGIGVGVGTGSAGAGGNWPSYQDVLARSSVYVNYQHSLNSLNDIIDRDDKESLAELHRYLHGDPGSSDEEEDDDDDDDDDEGEVINIGRDDDDAEHQEDGRDTPTYPLPTTTTTTTSSGASIKSERRHSLPVRASMASLAPSELTVSTPDPEQRAFQLRRRRAAKLTNFFGVDYRELIQDVLESIEKGVEEEHRRGTLQPDEVEELLMKLRTLKTKRRSNFAR